MTFDDSRRLTGPSLHANAPGVVLEATFGENAPAPCIDAWRQHARRLLDALGWNDESLFVRLYQGGASLGFTAPEDTLYAATEVNEAAWAAAVAEVSGGPPSDAITSLARLREEVETEQNPALRALHTAADAHGVAFFFDDDEATVGLGTGNQTWPVDALPDPGAVPWDTIHDVPVGLVTGTNGKSTTVRLAAAITAAAGRTAGISSTDFVRAGDRVVEQGDWSGPGGARAALREASVDLAILETARGGLLRRGLALERADVALVTNVAIDHMGDYGINTLDDLIEVKLTLRRAVETDGLLILNADDAGLVRHTTNYSGRRAWFSLDPDNEVLAAHRRAGGRTYFVEDGTLVTTHGDGRTEVCPVDEIPVTLGGAARHNVANALAAVALTDALGLPMEAIREGLRTFRNTPESNPGRGNFFDIGGARVLVDFAHNEHGVSAIARTARAIPAERRLVLFGQAGDRTDAEIEGLARAVWSVGPDHIVVTEMLDYLRGRAPGEIPALIADALDRQGASAEHITHVPDPITGVRLALDWMRPGDLLLLFVLTRRDEAVAMLREAQRHATEA